MDKTEMSSAGTVGERDTLQQDGDLGYEDGTAVVETPSVGSDTGFPPPGPDTGFGDGVAQEEPTSTSGDTGYPPPAVEPSNGN